MEYCNLIIWIYSREKINEYFEPKEKDERPLVKDRYTLHVRKEPDFYAEYIMCNDGVLREFDGIEEKYIPENEVYLIDIVHSTPWLDHNIREGSIDDIFVFSDYQDFIDFLKNCSVNKYESRDKLSWPNETLIRVRCDSIKSYDHYSGAYEYDTEFEIIGVIND